MFCAGLASAQDSGRFAPRLMRPLEFATFTVTDIVSQVEASNLMSQKVFVGDNRPDAYLILGTNFDGPRIRTETVNEYKAAIKAGYGPYNTFEITMQSWFKQPAEILDFMAKAQPSIHSQFQTKDLKYLPVSLLNWNDTDQKKQLDDDAAKGMTLKDCTTSYSKRHIHGLKLKDNTMTFSDDGCDYVITELARGDFDHDEYEDALIMISTYYQGGSGRSYSFYVVSKTDTKQKALQLADFSP